MFTQNNISDEDKLIRAKVQLYHKYPVFGAILLQLPVVCHYTEDFGTTACIDGRNVHLYMPWFSSITHEERLFTLIHEIYHWMLGHFWRRGHRNVRKANIAMDYAINLALDEIPNISRPQGTLHNKKYADMSFEEIYELLEDKEEEQNWGDHSFWGSGFEGSSEGEEDSSNGNEGKSEVLTSNDDQTTWLNRTITAVQAAKSMGNLPSSLIRQLDSILRPILPIRKILQPFLTAGEGTDDYSFTPTDRRFTHDDLFLPDLAEDDNRLDDVYICFDSSGSISNEELQADLAELKGILAVFPNVTGWVAVGDAAIQTFTKLTDKIDTSIFKGGGGTDFRPFFTEIINRKVRPRLALIFTDGYGTFPTYPPNYLVIWFMTSKVVAPFGMTVPYNRRYEN